MSLGTIVGVSIGVFMAGYAVHKAWSKRRRVARYRWADSLNNAEAERMLDALRSGDTLVVVDERVGRARFDEPPGLVSLFALTKTWGATDRSESALSLAGQGLRAKRPGYLPLSESWYDAPVAGLSAERFTETVHDVLTSTYAHGLVNHESDPQWGYATIGVDTRPVYDPNASAPENELWFDLREVLRRVHARPGTDAAEVHERIREVLRELVNEGGAGTEWLLPNIRAAERDIVLSCLVRR